MVVVVTLNCDLCVKILCCKYNHRRLLRQFVIIKTLIKTYMLVWVFFFPPIWSKSKCKYSTRCQRSSLLFCGYITYNIQQVFLDFIRYAPVWSSEEPLESCSTSFTLFFINQIFFNQFIYDGLKGISGTLQLKTKVSGLLLEKRLTVKKCIQQSTVLYIQTFILTF